METGITSVSFLGAGTIRDQSRGQVEGLATAGSILLAAVVGVSVALAQLLLAAGVTLIILITLQVLGRISKWIEGRSQAPNVE